MKKYILLSLLFCFSTLIFANNGIDPLKKQAKASRIEQAIKIDGVLDDLAWRTAQNADGFIQNAPKPGIDAMQKSEVKILRKISGNFSRKISGNFSRKFCENFVKIP